MKRVWAFGAAVLGTLALAGVLGVGAADRVRADAPGPKADNFRLTSADRQSYELYRMKDAAAVVVVTQANGCAPLRQAAPALKELKAGFAGKNVEFLMLNSNLTDTRDAVLAEATSAGYDMPVLLDPQQLAGEQLNVSGAGEVIILNPKTWQVAWRGSPAGAETALADVIAGRVPSAGSAPTTCSIAFPERAKAAQFARISYVRDVAPIIREKCVECHQSGGIGPMQLTSYERIKAYAPMIRETIRTQRMPPWHADPSVGQFHDNAGLTSAQIRTLVHWAEGGANRGTGADPLASVTFQAPEWPLGKPDLVLDIPAYTIPASGVVNYQRPWAANPGTEGRWLRASTFKIGQRQAVHHILTGYMTEAPGPGQIASESRWGTTLGTFAVGTNPTVMPRNVGALIPAGGAIGFQNHYTPFGREVVDNSQIGLYFYKEKPKLVMRTNTIIDPSITIPANTERHREVAYLTFPREALLYGAFIHAHYRGSGSELKIIYPNGTSKILISVPRYDFNWQRDYDFVEPIKIPAGSRLVATYIYDNSRRNPANPDPNRTIPWGEQSYDEMLYTTLRYRWIEETSDNNAGKAFDAQLMASRTLGIYDDNLDGKVQLSEIKGGAMGAGLRARFATLDVNKDGAIDASEFPAPAAAAPAAPASVARRR